jgi:hypothetical protein
MTKWVVALSLLIFAAWWLRREAWPDARPRPPVAAATAPSPPSPAPVVRRPTIAIAAPTSAASVVSDKLDIKSDELRNRLDEQIPRRLYAEAARCYQGGLDKDQRLDVTYRLHVTDGEVSVSDLRAVESTLEDSALERCIRERILAAKWRDDALPDLDEDDDLYMRVGGFSSYVAAR